MRRDGGITLELQSRLVPWNQAKMTRPIMDVPSRTAHWNLLEDEEWMGTCMAAAAGVAVASPTPTREFEEKDVDLELPP